MDEIDSDEIDNDPHCQLPSHWDLTVSGIEMVDVEIREVVAAINRLPCVSSTLFSCAGFGRAGMAPRSTQDYPADDPTGHFKNKSGYMTIEYKADVDSGVVREVMAKVFDWTRDSDERFRTTFRLPGDVVSYYIDGRYDVTADRDAGMRASWHRVLNAVKAHLVGGPA